MKIYNICQNENKLHYMVKNDSSFSKKIPYFSQAVAKKIKMVTSIFLFHFWNSDDVVAAFQVS